MKTLGKELGEMKLTLKGYTVWFTDDVGINHMFLMDAYRLDDVITEIKRIYGNVHCYSTNCGAPHGKGN